MAKGVKNALAVSVGISLRLVREKGLVRIA
jgi:hypothetical protein